MGKVEFLFSSSFLLVSTKFSFWEEDWALGYNSIKFWDLDVSQFPKIPSFRSFGNLWGNSYIPCLLLLEVGQQPLKTLKNSWDGWYTRKGPWNTLKIGMVPEKIWKKAWKIWHLVWIDCSGGHIFNFGP